MAAQTPPANMQGSTGGQGASGQQAAPTQPSPANPKAKHLPMAKTQAEYDAYTAIANSPDPAAAEKLAREFETQYPNSDLLALAYQQVLTKYQKADNGDKALEMGRKALQHDPDEIYALVLDATVLAERTRQTDIDRDQRLKEATTDAQRALEDIRNGNYLLPPSATPQQIEQYKDQVTSMAYQALGTADLEREDYVAAEQDLRKASQGAVGKGDAVTWFRLALALDHQNKFADANAAITTAVALAPAGSAVASMAANEQSRLKKLAAGGEAAAPAPAPASNQPQPEPVQPK
jgi:tetratricopeptide (TPR) repeat protein